MFDIGIKITSARTPLKRDIQMYDAENLLYYQEERKKRRMKLTTDTRMRLTASGKKIMDPYKECQYCVLIDTGFCENVCKPTLELQAAANIESKITGKKAETGRLT